MIKFRIGTEYLDQFDKKESFAISKAISKIGEINLRHGDRSTGFKVPLTAKNTRLLNYSTILSSSTNNQTFTKIFGQVVENDVVVGDGYFQVIKYNPYKKEVDLRFYGGNTDWFSNLKDRKINQNETGENAYNVSDFDLYITPENIEANINNGIVDADNPYKFFLIDNNKDSTRNNTNEVTIETEIDDYQIGFSQGAIFDKIFESQNIKLEGNLFEDPFYYNTLISSSYNVLNKAEIQASGVFRYTFSHVQGEPYPTQTIPYDQTGTKGTLEFNGGNPDPEFNGVEFTFLGDADNVLFDYNLNVKIAPSFTDPFNIKYDVYLNGGIIATDQLATITGSGAFRNAKCSYPFASVNDGDVIRFEFNTDAPPLASLVIAYGSTFDVYFENYTKRSYAKDLIPELTQSEFVKDVLVQFGCVTQYNQKKKVLTCNTFNVIEDNKRNAKDYSDKIDLSSDPIVDVTKLVSNYARNSYFVYEYADDSDNLNELYKALSNYNYGTGVLKINNAFLDDEKDFYTSPYSPTQMVETFPSSDPENLANPSYQLGNMFLPFVPIYSINSVDTSGNVSYDDNDLNPRKYYFLGNINIASAYKGNVTSLNIASTTNVTVLPLVYFDKSKYSFIDSEINERLEVLSYGILSDLNSSTGGQNDLEKVTLIDKYYSFQKKILDKPIYLEIHLRLTPLDIQNIDFFTPIWLNFGLDSGHYYIDEISQYQGSNKSTKVKLVKI